MNRKLICVVGIILIGLVFPFVVCFFSDGGGTDHPFSRERIGSERIGSERIGSERIGSERIGSEHIGSEHTGSEHTGSERIGTNQDGTNQDGTNQDGTNQDGTNQDGSDTSHPFSQGEHIGTVAWIGYNSKSHRPCSVQVVLQENQVALQESQQIWNADIKDNNFMIFAKANKVMRRKQTCVFDYIQPHENNMDIHYGTAYRLTGIYLLDNCKGGNMDGKGRKVDIEVSKEDIDEARKMIGK
jgi:hypothetical protein